MTLQAVEHQEKIPKKGSSSAQWLLRQWRMTALLFWSSCTPPPPPLPPNLSTSRERDRSQVTHLK